MNKANTEDLKAGGIASATTWDAVALAVDEAERNGLNYVTTDLLRKLLARTRVVTASAAGKPKYEGRASQTYDYVNSMVKAEFNRVNGSRVAAKGAAGQDGEV